MIVKESNEMNENQLDIEALDKLIKAVQDYQEELSKNRTILNNAANVCDAAMGKDAIAQKHIARLHEALEELQKTSDLARDVAASLIEEKRRAIDVLEDEGG